MGLLVGSLFVWNKNNLPIMRSLLLKDVGFII